MSVPKKRQTSSSVKQRRSHHSLKQIKLIKCPKCGRLIQPYHVCPFCGNYNGKEVIKIKVRKKSQ